MIDPQQPMVLPSAQPTEHAMLVVWGQFAQEIGLLQHLRHCTGETRTLTKLCHFDLAPLRCGSSCDTMLATPVIN